MRGLEPRCDVLAKSKPTNVIVWVRHVRSLQEICFLLRCFDVAIHFSPQPSHSCDQSHINNSTHHRPSAAALVCSARLLLLGGGMHICVRSRCKSDQSPPPSTEVRVGCRAVGGHGRSTHARYVRWDCANTCRELGPASFQSVGSEKLRLTRFRRLRK